ncbi:MAG: hypothetical protein AAF297_10300 [Planctomycetota bacterium]
MTPPDALDQALELKAAEAALEPDWSEADNTGEELEDVANRALINAIPPPPAGVEAVREELIARGEPDIALPETGGARPGDKKAPFDAELDTAEIDERDRPGPTWAARARGLSRSSLTFVSRRMCYAGRKILVAVHLIDEHPTPLYGVVRTCEYESEGLYRTELVLQQVPDRASVQTWIIAQTRS